MKTLRRILPWLAALLFLALLIFMLLRFTDKDAETPAVILPPVSTQNGSEGSGDGAGSQLTVADVRPETLVAVLRELDRAESYTRTLTVETMWAEGSGTESLSVWAKGNALRITSGKKHLLLSDQGHWLWYSDSDRVLTGGENLLAEADRYMRILRYEDLLEGEHTIIEARYTELEGEPCIFVSYRDGAFGYENRLYVSVANGLPLAAETYDGESLVYRMSSGPVDVSTPDESLLTPPGGAAVSE